MNLKTFKKIYNVVFSFSLLYSCQSSRTLNSEQVMNENCQVEKVVYRFESNDSDSTHLLSPNNSSMIVFYFFDGFEDTVAVTYNKIHFLAGSVFEDSSNISTKYSGVHFGVEVREQLKFIQVKLLRQQKCVFIQLYENYPLCTLSRENNVWIANYRIRKMELK